MSEIILSITLFATFFWLSQSGRMERHLAMALGGVVFALLGPALWDYSIALVFESIWYETLALIFGMSMISATLFRSGLFDQWAHRFGIYTGSQQWHIVVLMVLVTYSASLFVNNLAAMVVIVPVTLKLCQRTGISVAPVLVLEIIASNLGGASTMIGDFPNMIITSAGNLHFSDFIAGMMVPCLMLLAAMLGFLSWKQSREQLFTLSLSSPNANGGEGSSRKEPDVDRYLANLGKSVLFLALVGFFVAEFIEIRPAVIALLAGFVLLASGRFTVEEFNSSSGIIDIIYFLGLFVMVGGLKAAEVLEGVTRIIIHLGAGSHTLELLVLMWIAWAITPFLNAGPSTAFLIPIAADMGSWMPGDTVWWALSLGILAGSSAALTGATSGPVASSFEKKYRARYASGETDEVGEQLTFRYYLSWGLPISTIFMMISTLYILVVVA